MSTINAIQVPESLYRQVAILSKREGVSIEQFVASAIAEKAAAWAAEDYLQQRAARASREKFLQALSKVPDVEPDERDKMPAVRAPLTNEARTNGVRSDIFQVLNGCYSYRAIAANGRILFSSNEFRTKHEAEQAARLKLEELRDSIDESDN